MTRLLARLSREAFRFSGKPCPCTSHSWQSLVMFVGPVQRQYSPPFGRTKRVIRRRSSTITGLSTESYGCTLSLRSPRTRQELGLVLKLHFVLRSMKADNQLARVSHKYLLGECLLGCLEKRSRLQAERCLVEAESRQSCKTGRWKAGSARLLKNLQARTATIASLKVKNEKKENFYIAGKITKFFR